MAFRRPFYRDTQRTITFRGERSGRGVLTPNSRRSSRFRLRMWLGLRPIAPVSGREDRMSWASCTLPGWRYRTWNLPWRRWRPLPARHRLGVSPASRSQGQRHGALPGVIRPSRGRNGTARIWRDVIKRSCGSSEHCLCCRLFCWSSHEGPRNTRHAGTDESRLERHQDSRDLVSALASRALHGARRRDRRSRL